MRVGTPGFVPERLVEARAIRRISSKSQLARLLSVNPSTVTRWEDGTSAPDADALSALSRELRLRREYFLRPTYTSPKPMFNRILSSALVRDRNYQNAQMRWLHEVSAVIQHYVDYPSVDIPDVLGGHSYSQLRDEDIESIALQLRAHWQLGNGPCSNVVELMERVGCIVGSIEMGTAKLDGLCSWSAFEDRPHILLATDKMSFFRRQMDAAHELAHAILHKDVSADELKKNLKSIEKQAFRLASAFLLPSTSYPSEIVHPSLATLRSLKGRWFVSIKAQIKRLSDLKIIDKDHATYLYKLYSQKGWSRSEPLDDEFPLQEPRVLADAMNLIVDSNTRTRGDLLSVEFTQQAGDIENITNLPPGWFSDKLGEIVTLRSKSSSTSKPFQYGQVVPFPKKN